MLWGTTFSHRHAASLGIDPIRSFQLLLSAGFAVIRLGCYWDEIEQQENIFNFTSIEPYLKLAEESQQHVIVTVGMKAPRWPEFYIPVWLRNKKPEAVTDNVVHFVEKTITTLKHYSCITHWQVENEPLDPSGPEHTIIPFATLKRETERVKALDPSRKIVINLWGNELTKRDCCNPASAIADVIGLDVYYKVFVTKHLSHSFYLGPRDSDATIKTHMEKHRQPVWITELQAEPWEANHEAYLADDPRSMNPAILQKNVDHAKIMQPEAILLWGSEYWLWKAEQGDSRMWNAVQAIIKT